jgi:Zn-dependent peptidase ImmA (M78 family)
MEHVWKKVAELRSQHETLRSDRLPIEIFSFLELDLGLDPIPFDDLTSRYRVEAAIKADFTGIYLDAEQYKLMEKGPEWKLNRLRFTVAHELAHYFLHREIPQLSNFSTVAQFAIWTADHGGTKWKVEQEANEFAGRLLVPPERLEEFYQAFASPMQKLIPDFIKNSKLRTQFAETVASKFGVNAQVVEVRLDRDSIWPAS